jgi:hypothetical protein
MDFIVFLLWYPISLCRNRPVEEVEEHEPQEMHEEYQLAQS